MKHRWTHRLTVGFLGIATIFFVMWGCGRERVNPVDSNFEGNAALNPPGNIRAQGDILRITLNWNPVNSASLAGYGVWRSTSATGDFVRLRGEASAAEATTARTTFVDSTLDLSVSKIYFYKLTTVDVDGQASEFSAYVSAEALDDARAPGAPTNFVAITDVNNAQVTLGWSAPETDEGNAELTGLSEYKIFRIKDSQGSLQVQGPQEALVALVTELGIDLDNLGQLSEELANIFVQLGTVPSGQTYFVDTDRLEVGVLHVYLVTAVDPAGNTGRAAIALVTVQNPGASLPVPADLRATQNEQARIVISWNPVPNPNLLGYLVLRSQSTQGPFSPVTDDTLFTTGQTQYVDSLVVADEVYFYKVQTVVQDPQLGVLHSDTSTFIDGRAIVDESPPGAPSDLIVSLDDDHFQRVTLNWTAPTQDRNGGDLTGLASFEIFRSRDNNTSFALLATVSSDQVHFVDMSVELLTTYFYAIRAIDSAGNAGPRSEAVSVTTKGFAVPRNVRAEGGVQKITLAWNANTEPELTGYEILRFADPKDETPDRVFDSVLTTYVDTPVVAGYPFVYRVRAVGLSNVKSELSAFVSAQAEELVPVLAVPRNVRAEGGVQKITLAWNANTEPELTGYRVLRYTDPAQTTPEETFMTVQTTYVDSPLVSGQTFVYRVQAVGVNNEESELSQYAAAMVSVDESPPGAPSDLIVSLDDDHFQRVTLNWTAPTQDRNGGDLTGLASFEIFRSRDNNTSFALLATVSSDQVRFVDMSVELLTTYFYAIRAIDSAGNAGPRSEAVSVTTKGFAVPRNVRAEGGVQKITLAWNANTEIELTGYRVLRYTDPAQTTPEETFMTVQTTYVDSPLVSGQTFVYRVQAIGANNEESELSQYAAAMVSVDESPPGAPSDLIVSLDDDHFQRVTLNWTAPTQDRNGGDLTGLASFEIFRSRDNNTSFALLATVSSDQVRFVDMSVELLTTYFYAIRAIDSAGNAGPRSEAVSVTTKGFAAPRNVRAEGGVQKITLAWNANTEPELTGYEILRFADPKDETPDRVFDSVLTTYVDTPVVAGHPFVYRVRAVGPSNVKSELSAFVSAQAEELVPVLAAPRNVRAEGGVQKITLAWNANTEIELTGYRVLRYTDPAQTTPEETFMTVQTTYVDSPLVSGQTFVYRVQAIGANNEESELSQYAAAMVSVDESPPGAPSDLIVSLDDDHFQRVTLNWTAPTQDRNGGDLTGLASFEIFRSRDNNTSFALLATVSSDQVRFVDMSVELLTTYFYAIRAIDSAGNAGPRSEAVSVTTKGFAVPRNVRAEGGVQKITLAWNANTEIELTGYRVLRYTDPAQTTPEETFMTVQTTYVDSPLVSGQTFVYRVQAIGANNEESELSQYAAAMVSVDESPPGAPSDLIVSLDDDHFQRVTLNWTAPTQDRNGGDLTGLASFEIFRSRDNNTSFALLATVSSDQVRFVDMSVELLTTYFYAIRAIDSAGNAGPRSEAVSVTTKGFAAPRNVRATGGIGQITIGWLANTEIELTGYRVLRYTDPAETMPAETFLTVQTTYVDSPLASGQTFVYRVQAIGANNEESELSLYASAEVLVDDVPPATPGNFTAIPSGGTAIELRWNAPKTDANDNELTGLSGYRIYRGTSGASPTLLVRVDASKREYVDRDDVKENTAYAYQITAIDGNGNESPRSDRVTARTEAGVVPPRNLRAVYDSDAQAVTLRWVAPRVYDSFYVERAVLSAGSASSQNLAYRTLVSDHGTTSYVDSDVASGTTYVYRVSVYFNGRISEPTEAVVIQIP